MPSLRTRADSLREYLTGASSDGGTQSDPNASLGNFRSASEALSYGMALSVAVTNLTVDYASGGNAPGAGTLSLLDADTVAWQDSGGTQGLPVVLPGVGSQAVVESGESAGAFLRVTRTSNSPMTGGPSTILLATLLDNLFGFDDVTSAAALSGGSEYRCSMLVNESAAAVTNFKRWLSTLGTQQVSNVASLLVSGAAGVLTTTGSFADWPASGWCRISSSVGALKEIVYYSSCTAQTLTVPATGRGRLGTSYAAGLATDKLDAVPGLAIGVDTHNVQAGGSACLTVGSTTTAPAGVTFGTGITAATGVSVSSIPASSQLALWYWREIPAAAYAAPLLLNKLSTSYDAA